MADTPYSTAQVEVPGGNVLVGQWGRGDEIIVASHGITANHLSWLRVGQLVDQQSHGAVRLVAIDHRGRAGSAEHPGPFGLPSHADDLVAVLDHFGQSEAVVIGHSMGAFVAATAAERHPRRVERLVLMDGGLPFAMEIPPDADVEAVVQSVIGPALDRLDQRWENEDAYVDFFRAHPAFQPPNVWTETVEAYVRHDAVTSAQGDVRSSASKEAVLVDGGAAIVDPAAARAIERVATPTNFLWAPRGILDQSPGLYTQQQVDTAVEQLPHLSAELVEEANHYTIAVGEAGAAAATHALLRS